MPTNRNRLFHLRKAKGLTQLEAANEIGIHRVTVAKMETGEYCPGQEVLEKVADWLNIPVGVLGREFGLHQVQRWTQ